MTAERSAALDRFFEEQVGRARTAGDALVQADTHLADLEDALSEAGSIDEDVATPQRIDVGAVAHQRAIALGRAVIDGLVGMTISGAVSAQVVPPRRDGLEHEVPPLETSWQRVDNPWTALAGRSAALREMIGALDDQPNQLYRRLYEVLALAADIAAWTAWTQLGRQPSD